jgi:hypothetical protein
MITPERFEVLRGRRLAMVLMAGVLLMASAAAAWFAVHGIAGASDPHAALIGMSTVAGLFGLTGLLVGYDARRAWHSAITLRDGGLEVELGDETPSFFSWGQVGGLKMRSAMGGMEVLGQGEERLFSVDSRLPRVGRLLHAILVNGVFPKRAPILPYHAERAVPRQIPIGIALALGVGAFAMLANTPAEVRQVVLMSFGAIAVVAAAVALLASRLGGGGTTTVDADGITLGRAGSRRPWSSVQGAALAFVRGHKGERFPRVALQGMDGGWEPINLPGTDLVELLAAINAAAPGKVILPPDEPLGLANRLGFTFKKDVAFRIGPPKK